MSAVESKNVGGNSFVKLDPELPTLLSASLLPENSLSLVTHSLHSTFTSFFISNKIISKMSEQL
jgi:hypothetical protein